MNRLAPVALLLSLPAAAQTSKAFADLPGVTFQYYDVAGTDAAAIHRALLKARPTDPHDGKRVDALTQTWLQWSWPVGGKTCRLDQAVVTMTATVQLPRLARRATVSPELRARWDAYIAQLEAHEAQHIHYSYDGRKDVLTAIQAATCDTANDAAKIALAAIQARDIDLDRRTSHGEKNITGF